MNNPKILGKNQKSCQKSKIFATMLKTGEMVYGHELI